jgi:hypothetical protein
MARIKYQAGVAGATGAATGAGSTTGTAGGFGNFMNNNGDKIVAAAGTIAPLLMKKPELNAKPYKKGSKLIKYDEGTKSTDTSKTGAIYFKGKLKGGEEKKAPVENEKPKAKQSSQEKEIKGFYQGSGLKEYGATMGIPALAQMLPPKLGWLKNAIKFAPGAARFGSDVLSEAANPNVDVQWWSRIGNLLKDIGLGTASTATVRTIGKTAEKLGQGYKAAAKNTKNPTIPSVSQTVKEAAPEALKASTVNKLATKVTGNENMIGNMMKANKNAKNAEMRKPVQKIRYTGPATEKLGVPNEFYFKGKTVDEKTFKKTTQERSEKAKELLAQRAENNRIAKEKKKEERRNKKYERSLKQQDPGYKQAGYVQEKKAEFNSQKTSEGVKDFSEDIQNFRKDYAAEKRRINTQPKDPGITDAQHQENINSQLENLEKRKVAFFEGVEKNKTLNVQEVAKKAAAKKSNKAVENKESVKTEPEVKPASTRVRRPPASSANKNQDVDAGKRESAAPTSSGRKRVSNKKTSTTSESSSSSGKASTGTARKKGGGESKEFSGRMPPGMIPGMPAGAKKKANGAKLIKYK